MQELGPVDGVSPTIAGEAIELLTAAAERADDNGSLRHGGSSRHRGPWSCCDRGAADEPRRVTLQLVRAAASIDLRHYDAANADLDAALTIAARRRDTVAEAECHRLLGGLHHVAGRLDEARLELGRAVDLLRTADRPDRLARTLRARGFIEMFGGSLTDAEWFFGEADTLYRQLGDERGLA